jgi:hypothetical protein
MKVRAAHIGGLAALSVAAGVFALSHVGAAQCGQWAVSKAVGFFTHQDVSPDRGGLTNARPSLAAEERRQRGARDAEPSPGDAPPLRLSSVENKKAAAETGLAVLSGRMGVPGLDAETPEASSPASAVDPAGAGEDPAGEVQQVKGRIVSTMSRVLDLKEKDSAAVADEPSVGSETEGVLARVDAAMPGGEAGPSAGDLLRSSYAYASGGRRDPFKPLLREGDGDGNGNTQRQATSRLNLDGARLVGILSGGTHRLALLEDAYGFSYCVEEGDRVVDGRASEIQADAVVFYRYRFGKSETIVLHLDEQGKKAGGI